MKLTHCLSILSIAAIVASCSKTGPTGPQGPSGVANINTIDYTVTNWSDPSSNTTWIASYYDGDITNSDLDAVEVYWSNAASGWLALPVTSLISTGDELSYGYDNNSITFSYYTGGSAVLPPSAYNGYGTIYFKVTVIHPAVQVKYPNTNWKNAAEVANIPEVHAALTGTAIK